jgi:hypothetical protein
MTYRIQLAATLASMFAVMNATAQRPDSVTGELRRTFRNVTAVSELSDGRALVLDSHERFVYLADFRTGETKVIGEQGWGDRQYLWPSRLLHRSNDTTLVWDAIAGRVHVLAWNGEEPGIRRSIEKSSFSALTPIESDGRGRLYSEVPAAGGGSALIRWSPGESRVDTLFRFERAGVRGLFPSSDRWIVNSSGAVALVHVSPYRVELRVPGSDVVEGGPIPFVPKQVTPALQKAWAEALREPRIIWTQTRGEQPRFEETEESWVDHSGPWPLVTPAILGNDPMMQFTSDGSLLIERTAIPSLPSEYDVIDQRAVLKDRFELPVGTRIVATGRDVLYVTARGSDKRLTLQRFTFRRPR